MKTINTITRRLDNITQENLNMCRRILCTNPSDISIWKGSKRYAH